MGSSSSKSVPEQNKSSILDYAFYGDNKNPDVVIVKLPDDKNVRKAANDLYDSIKNSNTFTDQSGRKLVYRVNPTQSATENNIPASDIESDRITSLEFVVPRQGLKDVVEKFKIPDSNHVCSAKCSCMYQCSLIDELKKELDEPLSRHEHEPYTITKEKPSELKEIQIGGVKPASKQASPRSINYSETSPEPEEESPTSIEESPESPEEEIESPETPEENPEEEFYSEAVVEPESESESARKTTKKSKHKTSKTHEEDEPDTIQDLGGLQTDQYSEHGVEIGGLDDVTTSDLYRMQRAALGNQSDIDNSSNINSGAEEGSNTERIRKTLRKLDERKQKPKSSKKTTRRHNFGTESEEILRMSSEKSPRSEMSEPSSIFSVSPVDEIPIKYAKGSKKTSDKKNH